MATYQLRKVTRLPQNRFVVRWPGGSFSLTEEEYRALGRKGADAPPNRSGLKDDEWLDLWHSCQASAEEALTWDTISGEREPGDVTDFWPGVVRVRSDTGKDIVLRADRVSGDLDKITVDSRDLPSQVSLVNGVLTDSR